MLILLHIELIELKIQCVLIDLQAQGMVCLKTMWKMKDKGKVGPSQLRQLRVKNE